MNLNTIMIGLLAILGGLVGLAIESNYSARDNRERGCNYTRTEFIFSIWTLILTGTVLTIFGLMGRE